MLIATIRGEGVGEPCAGSERWKRSGRRVYATELAINRNVVPLGGDAQQWCAPLLPASSADRGRLEGGQGWRAGGGYSRESLQIFTQFIAVNIASWTTSSRWCQAKMPGDTGLSQSASECKDAGHTRHTAEPSTTTTTTIITTTEHICCSASTRESWTWMFSLLSHLTDDTHTHTHTHTNTLLSR